MREINIRPASAFRDPGRKLIESGGTEVGNSSSATNSLPTRMFVRISADRPAKAGSSPRSRKWSPMTAPARAWSSPETKINMVCPWHGFEFDIRTGRHPGNPRYRLKSVKVRVEGADVIVTLPDEKKNQNVT